MEAINIFDFEKLGERGVEGIPKILRSELDMAMALCGCPSVAGIGRDLIDAA